MDFDIPIDPTLLPCVTSTVPPPLEVNELSTTLPPPPTLQSTTRAVGSVSVNGGEVHIIPQRDEQGRLTSSGYAFRESL
jgi:hypothetical protein